MTLFASLVVLAATVTLGLALVLLHGMRRLGLVWLLGPLHGLAGVSGLVLLVLALRGPARGVAYGAGGFGTMAAVLLGLTVLAGLVVMRVRQRKGDPMLAIGLHATLAIFGFVVLAAYASVPA